MLRAKPSEIGHKSRFALASPRLRDDTPYFYWTFDDFENLRLEQNSGAFDGSVWKCNAISSYAIGASHLTFDAPAEWGEGSRPVRFVRTADGLYEHRFEDTSYSGIRADTQHHVILTDRWTETDYGRGVFILVLPIKKSEQTREPLMEAVPVGSGAPGAAAVAPSHSWGISEAALTSQQERPWRSQVRSFDPGGEWRSSSV